jgi:hypothetical protein
VTFVGAAQGIDIDLAVGNDRVSLDNYMNTLTISNVESISGGTANDILTIDTETTGGSFSLGAGNDSMTFTDGLTATFTAIETVVGSAESDSITLTANYQSANIDGGADFDYVYFAAAGTAMISNVEVIIGGAGTNVVILSGSAAASIDLGTGDDKVTLSDGIQGVSGGTGADQFIWTNASQSTNAATDIIYDFTTGTDKLVFDGLLTGTFDYVGNGAFTSGGHTEARFVNASNTLQMDLDGNGTVDMEVKMNLVQWDDLSENDFSF